MNARLASRIETGVELLASALLSGAVAYAALALLQDGLPHPQAALLAAAIGAGTFLLTSLAFRRKAATPTFRTPAFPLPALEIPKPEELLLGDEDRLAPDELVLGEADRLEPEPLELDDVLAQLEPDYRVVQLFDRKALAIAPLRRSTMPRRPCRKRWPSCGDRCASRQRRSAPRW